MYEKGRDIEREYEKDKHDREWQSLIFYANYLKYYNQQDTLEIET